MVLSYCMQIPFNTNLPLNLLTACQVMHDESANLNFVHHMSIYVNKRNMHVRGNHSPGGWNILVKPEREVVQALGHKLLLIPIYYHHHIIAISTDFSLVRRGYFLWGCNVILCMHLTPAIIIIW